MFFCGLFFQLLFLIDVMTYANIIEWQSEINEKRVDIISLKELSREVTALK